MTGETGLAVLPLRGVRVLEFGQVAAAPFCSMLLADLGADVVKIERPPLGDAMRQWPPLSIGETGEGFSENFASLNRNKRSIACDLNDESERRILRALCDRADVLIENFRPGVLRQFGLAPEDLRATNARLVYCSITGYGQLGPYASRGAFDVTIQAAAGLMSVTGPTEGAAVKAGVPMADFATGLYAAFSIMAALRTAESHGVGAFLDSSMLDATLGIAALQTSEYFGTGRDPRALGSAHPRNAPYQAFYGSDAPFVLAAGNQKLWVAVCEMVGREELVADRRFATQLARAEHQEELALILQKIFDTRTAAEWLAAMEARGIPCAPINTYSQILSDPHVAVSGLVEPLELPNGVLTRTVGFPVRFDEERVSVRLRPPRVGEHTQEVIEEWLAPDPTRPRRRTPEPG
jgi:succinate---hydroxymethylglutarate CoA-transferase